jgi:hypothetical protein
MLFRGTAGINLPVYDMFVIDGIDIIESENCT